MRSLPGKARTGDEIHPKALLAVMGAADADAVILPASAFSYFFMLSGSYAKERNQIAAGIPQKEVDIQRLRETVSGTDGFLNKAKRYTDITELTPNCCGCLSRRS